MCTWQQEHTSPRVAARRRNADQACMQGHHPAQEGVAGTGSKHKRTPHKGRGNRLQLCAPQGWEDTGGLVKCSVSPAGAPGVKHGWHAASSPEVHALARQAPSHTARAAPLPMQVETMYAKCTIW